MPTLITLVDLLLLSALLGVTADCAAPGEAGGAGTIDVLETADSASLDIAEDRSAPASDATLDVDNHPILGIGDPYPDVSVSDCNGTQVGMRALLAQHDATYVNLSAGWCVASQEEAPFINSEVVDGFSNQGQDVGAVQILIESQPGQAPSLSLCRDWRDTLQARYTVLVDMDQVDVEPFFGATIETLPLHLVITRDGIIRFKKSGGIPADIKSIIEGLLPTP